MKDTLKQLKGGLIVSCQSEGNDPFNTPEGVTLFAKAAQMAGAVAIRSEGIEKIRQIKKEVPLPMIGLLKGKFPDGTVKITGSFQQVEQLIGLGCEIIAIDGTDRIREGLTGHDFIASVKKNYPETIIMADVAQFEEGIRCRDAGADCLSTTLSGYTPDTSRVPDDAPDFELLSKLSAAVEIPVICEGRIKSPAHAKTAMEMGAYAVVVGTVITRPRVVMSWYKNAIEH
ncbi:MAG: N-acetylmannosamine-6-phosphate 2-epimerase [Ignavibacteriales bacterium]|mgnify:CR=1 FL=1|nr:MAG: N-acetylmannosamine-6-phosphate 2-epimerase [Ignavibacteriaceae bacterium]MBW7871802.1 N-acetylmannosamine-6-phosphate 2-epimerase [Ignavibacteria bacterium]MCZ2144348.1 N-acetylmannosamine-6-phosphate 2-epimerase [Ignavibacteriales bacterium]OQY75526.1 MAG: N-acetylmannosamine-6-phosphate 2-epimerase [Ignavibacteriales bacterium UTCHB3]MBV6446301.1 putative N-acetylmannosamine-6-phosphate 2-epimerase [Ignavibacteriaceae bacterium]